MEREWKGEERDREGEDRGDREGKEMGAQRGEG